jgi:PAS domain S-box-containing protein
MAVSAMEMTLSRKRTKIRTRGRKLHLTGTKARVGRAHRTRADLEQQLKACRREIARERKRLVEAMKQQTATSEVLRIITDSPIQSVLDAVAEHAARLCGSNNAEIFGLENDLLRLVASYGEIPVALQAREGIPVNRDSVTGRATCDRRTVHVGDLASEDSEYPLGSSNAKREGHRTTLATPLLRERTPVGVILVRRREVRPFSDNQIALLEIFAEQAVIAIENVRLFEAEKQRTLALARANRDLAQREAKIRRLVDSNIIGIFVWDFDGGILEANEAFLHIVGYDHEDLVAGRLRWTDLTPPEWRDRDTRLIKEHKVTGTLQPFEKEYLRKDGNRVPVLIGVATFEEGGDQGVAFVLDLTERKRAEERLRAQHMTAQILAEAATIEEATLRILQAMSECLRWDVGALWRVDRKAEALRCVELWHKASIQVPEFERVSRESTFIPGLGLPGRVWSSLQPEYVPDVVSDENFPRGPSAEREELHAALAFPILLGGEALGVIEFFSREIRQPDQELLNVLATIGSQIGQFIERKRAEEALQASEANFRAAIDGIAGLVAIMAPSGEVETVNRPLIEYFGRPVEDLKNWGTSDAVHPEDLPRVLESYRTSLAAGTPFHYELRLRRFDGEYRWYENRGAPIRDESGRITRWYCLLVDTDDRTRALARLQQMQSDLAHMNRVSIMGELAASLSHEITQPIASARNNARAARNFLDKQPMDLGEVREALECVVGDTDRAGEIIDRIRDHIKKAPTRKDHFDINSAIKEVIALARSTIVKNGVSVQTRLAEALFPIHGDRVQLQQVVLNLLLNAVEAMGSSESEARELSISTEQDHKGVLVAVRDSGPGIDATHLERIFEAFYTTKSSGVGMGLSICRSIIDAHGGQLWADANQPRGAVFHFTLPGAEREVTNPPQASHRT